MNPLQGMVPSPEGTLKLFRFLLDFAMCEAKYKWENITTKASLLVHHHLHNLQFNSNVNKLYIYIYIYIFIYIYSMIVIS